MFKLIRLNDDKYAVIGKNVNFEGSQTAIITKMIRMGVDDDEIATGLMAVDLTDFAEYGINKQFIFSSNFKRGDA